MGSKHSAAGLLRDRASDTCVLLLLLLLLLQVPVLGCWWCCKEECRTVVGQTQRVCLSDSLVVDRTLSALR